LTLRDLAGMAEARVDAEWNHTSAILAMLANVNRDPKHSSYHPEDFHPLRRRRNRSAGIPVTRDNIGLLKVFCSSGIAARARKERDA